MSFASTVSHQADRLLARSTWTRHSLAARVVAAVDCRVLVIGVPIGVFAPFGILGTVAWVCVGLLAAWFAIMLIAYVTNSRVWMIVTIWGSFRSRSGSFLQTDGPKPGSGGTDLDEAGGREVVVERERLAQPPPPHQREARGVHEGIGTFVVAP
jgi:hypothetical protein